MSRDAWCCPLFFNLQANWFTYSANNITCLLFDIMIQGHYGYIIAKTFNAKAISLFPHIFRPQNFRPILPFCKLIKKVETDSHGLQEPGTSEILEVFERHSEETTQ